MKFFKLKNYILVVLLFMFWVTSNVSAQTGPRVFFEGSRNLSLGQNFTVKIYTDSGSSINALDLEVIYDKSKIELSSINDAGSIVSLWQQKKEIGSGRIALSGGMFESFSGKRGLIVALNFKAVAPGVFNISLERKNLYVADGKGTLLSSPPFSFLGTITENVSASSVQEDTLEPVEVNDDTPPELELSIVKSPIEKVRIVAFNASDKESGIKETSIQYKKWWIYGEWQEATNPETLPKNSWAVRIKATNNQGLTTEKDAALPSIILVRLGLYALFVVFLALFLVYNKGKQKNEI